MFLCDCVNQDESARFVLSDLDLQCQQRFSGRAKQLNGQQLTFLGIVIHIDRMVKCFKY